MAFLHIFVTGYRDKQNRQRENINTMYMFFQKFFPYVLSTKIFLVINFIFLEQFKVHSKTEENKKRFLRYCLPHTCIASSIINLPYQNGAFITIGESTLAHHNHPKSILHYGSLLVLYLEQNFLILMRSNLSIFFFHELYFWCCIYKVISKITWIFSMLSFRSFRVNVLYLGLWSILN